MQVVSRAKVDLAVPIVKKDYDFIIVLGANGDRSSAITQDRISVAIQAKKLWPHAKLLLTGNESRQEISVYREMLTDAGLKHFIEETKSTCTWENILFSQKLIPKGATVLLITSQFHQRRALAMARSVGMQADTFGQDPRTYKKSALFFIKERLSNLRYFPQMLIRNLLKN